LAVGLSALTRGACCQMERYYRGYLLVLTIAGIFLAALLYLGVKDANERLASRQYFLEMETLKVSFVEQIDSLLATATPLAGWNPRQPDSLSLQLLDANAADAEVRLTLYSSDNQSTPLIQQAPSNPDTQRKDLAYQQNVSLVSGYRLELEVVPGQQQIRGLYLKNSTLILVTGWAFILACLLFLSLQARWMLDIQKLAQRRGEALSDANKRLEQLARTDGLTGLVNRRGFDKALQQEWHRCAREMTALSLVIADIDHFKAFNDLYGHPEGDQCLISVGNALKKVLFRPGDIVARYGGEEFALILPGTDEGARIVAERCRLAIEGLQIEHKGAEGRQVVTISLGVATIKPSSNGSEAALIAAADKALYRAKHLGRDQVGLAQPEDFLIDED